MKHTPAPWLVMGNQRNGHFDFVLPCADDKDFQANARLIASSPELLEALEDCYSELNQLAFLSGDNLAKLTLDKARAAIAKAKGE